MPAPPLQPFAIRIFKGVNEGTDPADLPDGQGYGQICQNLSPVVEPGALTKMKGCTKTHNNCSVSEKDWVVDQEVDGGTVGCRRFYNGIGKSITGSTRVAYTDNGKIGVVSVIAKETEPQADKEGALWMPEEDGLYTPYITQDGPTGWKVPTAWGECLYAHADMAICALENKFYILWIDHWLDIVGPAHHSKATLSAYNTDTGNWDDFNLWDFMGETGQWIDVMYGCDIRVAKSADGNIHVVATFTDVIGNVIAWHRNITDTANVRRQAIVTVNPELFARCFIFDDTAGEEGITYDIVYLKSIGIHHELQFTRINAVGAGGILPPEIIAADAAYVQPVIVVGAQIGAGDYYASYREPGTSTIFRARRQNYATNGHEFAYEVANVVDFSLHEHCISKLLISYFYLTDGDTKLYRHIQHGLRSSVGFPGITQLIKALISPEVDHVCTGAEHECVPKTRQQFGAMGITMGEQEVADKLDSFALDCLLEFVNLIEYPVELQQLMVVDAKDSDSTRWLWKWYEAMAVWVRLGEPDDMLEIASACDKARFVVKNQALRAACGVGREQLNDRRFTPQVYSYIRTAFGYNGANPLIDINQWKLSYAPQTQWVDEPLHHLRPFVDIDPFYQGPRPLLSEGIIPTPIIPVRDIGYLYTVVFQDVFGNYSLPISFCNVGLEELTVANWNCQKVIISINLTSWLSFQRIRPQVKNILVFRANTAKKELWRTKTIYPDFRLWKVIDVEAKPMPIYGTSSQLVHTGGNPFTGTNDLSGALFGAGAFDDTCSMSKMFVCSQDYTKIALINLVTGGIGLDSRGLIYTYTKLDPAMANFAANDKILFCEGIAINNIVIDTIEVVLIDWGMDLNDQPPLENFLGYLPPLPYNLREPAESTIEVRSKSIVKANDRLFYIDALLDPEKQLDPFAEKNDYLMAWAINFLGVQPDRIPGHNIMVFDTKPKGACVIADRLVIFEGDRFHVGIVDGTENEWQFDESFEGPGCNAYDSIVPAKGRIFHSDDGGFRMTLINGESANIGKFVWDTHTAFSGVKRKRCFGEMTEMQDERTVIVWGFPSESKTLVYFVDENIWIVYETGALEIVESARGVDGELFALTKDAIYRLFYSDTFYGAPIETIWKSKRIDLGSAERLKEFGYIEVEHKSDTPIEVEVTVDDVPVVYTLSTSVTRGTQRITLPWGTIGHYIEVKMNIPAAHLELNLDFTIYALTMWWRPTSDWPNI